MSLRTSPRWNTVVMFPASKVSTRLLYSFRPQNFKSQISHIELGTKATTQQQRTSTSGILVSPQGLHENLPLAPSKADDKSYYVDIDPKYFPNLFSNVSFGLARTVFVSAAVLRGVAVGNLDPTSGPTAEECITFLEAPNAAWQEQGQILSQSIPIRLQSGELGSATVHDDLRDQWRSWIYREFKVPNSKPPRTSDFPLTHPLKIYPLPQGYSKWVEHGEGFIAYCVDDVNQQNKLEYSEAEPDKNADWKLLSKDPFGLYATYIHIDDWHLWMKHLDTFDGKREPPSVRPFVKVGQTGKMEEAMVNLAQEGNQLQNHIVDKNGGQDGVSKVTLEEIGVDPKKAKRTKATHFLSRRAQNMGMAEGQVSYDDKGVTMYVVLAAEKIKKARGMRDMEESQKQVMGGVTAPMIADSLGWSKNMHAFWPAEWLHLSGFAFGGFGMPGQDGYSSSQMPFNLVFGTSETNSLMTRYENAWQDVLEKEEELSIRWSDLTRKYDNKNIKEPQDASLTIRTNAANVPIEFDHYDSVTDEYTTRRFCLFPDDEQALRVLETIRAEPNPHCKLDEVAMQEGGTVCQLNQNPGVSPETMRAHINEYPFLAYSIEYTLSMTTRLSYLFNQQRAVETTVHFFPFSRPLLHKAEVDLDRVVINNLYAEALAGLESYREDLIEGHIEEELVEDSDAVTADKPKRRKNIDKGHKEKGADKGSRTMKKSKQRADERASMHATSVFEQVSQMGTINAGSNQQLGQANVSESGLLNKRCDYDVPMLDADDVDDEEGGRGGSTSEVGPAKKNHL